MTRQVIRFTAFFALMVAASHNNAANADAWKGIRAVVFSGGALPEPVRIHDTGFATTVWLRLRAGSVLPADSAAVVTGRKCVVISAYIFNERNENLAVEDLPAGRGDYIYRMFLRAEGELPVMVGNDRIWRLNAASAQDLVALGVPIADTSRTSAGCP